MITAFTSPIVIVVFESSCIILLKATIGHLFLTDNASDFLSHQTFNGYIPDLKGDLTLVVITV